MELLRPPTHVLVSELIQEVGMKNTISIIDFIISIDNLETYWRQQATLLLLFKSEALLYEHYSSMIAGILYLVDNKTLLRELQQIKNSLTFNLPTKTTSLVELNHPYH